MRFTGERPMQTPVEQLWEALHDGAVLRTAIPGCDRLVPLGRGRFSATLAVRVGPIADTYSGSFDIEDLRDGEHLRVRITGKGRLGRMSLDLDVRLGDLGCGESVLRYDAQATVGGFVARLGTPALTVAGGHLTGAFFRDLDRSLRRAARVPALV